MSHHDRRYGDSEGSGRHRAEQQEQVPELYSIFRGEVASIQAYGAFVKIPGFRKNGLVHKTQISSARVEDVSEVLAVGDRVFCKVISHGEEDNLKISLSMKMVDQGNGKDQDPNLVQTKKYGDNEGSGRHRMEQQEQMPELYSIFRGEVASIQEYGAFVKIPGFRKNGLVHKTQISSTRVEDVSEVLAVGDRVFCKVISHGDEDNLKISLSMKVLDQGNGKDHDPNLVQTKQEEQRRKKGQSFVQPKIELGAVFNTVCRKCGTKGHLAKDCFKAPGSKSYELLPEDDTFLQADDSQATKASSHKKKKKKKEKKKKKKSKKRRKRVETSDSSDSDSSSERHSRKRRRSAGKSKRHNRGRSSSSEVSPESSSSDGARRHRKQPREGGREALKEKAVSSRLARHPSADSPDSGSSSDDQGRGHGRRHEQGDGDSQRRSHEHGHGDRHGRREGDRHDHREGDKDGQREGDKHGQREGDRHRHRGDRHDGREEDKHSQRDGDRHSHTDDRHGHREGDRHGHRNDDRHGHREGDRHGHRDRSEDKHKSRHR